MATLQFSVKMDERPVTEVRLTKKLSFAFATLCLSAALALSAADYQRMDVKSGQWQTTYTNQMTGAPPLPEEVLNRLTPEQRAKLEAAMKARNGKTSVYKSCLTKDQLDKGFDVGNQATKACSHTLVTSSSHKQEIKVECNQDQVKAKGTITIEAIDSETVKGNVMMVATNSDGRTMNVTNTFTSKWIGPACSEK